MEQKTAKKMPETFYEYSFDEVSSCLTVEKVLKCVLSSPQRLPELSVYSLAHFYDLFNSKIVDLIVLPFGINSLLKIVSKGWVFLGFSKVPFDCYENYKQ